MSNTYLNSFHFLKDIEKVVKKKDSYGNIITVLNIINLPASDYDIEKLKNAHKIPSDYERFLLESDGAKLFVYDDIDGLHLLGLKDINKYTEYAKNTFEDDWDESVVIFAKIIGEDNYIGFKSEGNDQYVILDCYFEENPSEWKVIGNSFGIFLSEFLSQKGKKFWIK